MAQANRKTQVKSFSLDVVTLERMQHVIKSHYSNQLGMSDFVQHAIVDFCARVDFAEQSGMEIPIPQSRWG